MIYVKQDIYMYKKDCEGKCQLSTQQILFAFFLMAPIAIAGYIIGRDQPVPPWIERHLIPGLGWFGLILIAIVVLDWLKNVLRSKKDQH